MAEPSRSSHEVPDDILYSGARPRHVRHLGEGKAAVVSLVRTGDGRPAAEKLFTRGSLFSRTLYKLSFLAPLPYHTDYHAVAAAYYTRRLVSGLTRLWYGSSRVADALYVRQDPDGRGWILGTEYVKGRGPDPNRRDGKHEMEGLKSFMDDLSKRLGEWGLLGVMWQTDRSLSVPTSNFIMDRRGDWILVDLEPGVPGIALWGNKAYLRQARRKGLYPLFGDADLPLLRKRISELEEGEDKESLKSHYRGLERHLKAWKRRELAPSRRGYGGPAPYGGGGDPARRKAYLADFRRRFGTPHGTLRVIGRSWLLVLAYLMLADSLHTFTTREGLERWRLDRYRRLEREGRVPPGTRTGLLKHTLLSLFVFKELHRWWSDPSVRAKHRNLGAFYLTTLVDEWDSMGRLLPAEKERMLASRDEANANLRGFGYHLLLKPLSLIFDTVSIGGVIVTASWEPLLIMLIAPALRVCATVVVWAQERMEGRRQRIGIALVVGALPKAGILGFPAQLYSRNRSVFGLISDDLLSSAGEKFPVFGARNSTLEHWLVRRNFWVRERRFGEG